VSTLEELEAQLVASLDPAVLAVYADALTECGDRRGEVIAIDLRIDAVGLTPELTRARREALIAWLGAEGIDGGSRVSTTKGMRHWNLRRFRYGLFDDYRAAFRYPNYTYIRALYASPAAPFLRGVSMRASNLFPDQFDQLASRPHPWLRRLELNRFWRHAPSSAWHDAFGRIPHLEELWIQGTPASMGRPVMFNLHHPSVRRLVIEDPPGTFHQREFPRVEELSLMRFPLETLRDFPNVRRLDLSRAGGLWPPTDLPDRIELLRLPAPRDVHEHKRIRTIARERQISRSRRS
jgi:hypothetical protein